MPLWRWEWFENIFKYWSFLLASQGGWTFLVQICVDLKGSDSIQNKAPSIPSLTTPTRPSVALPACWSKIKVFSGERAGMGIRVLSSPLVSLQIICTLTFFSGLGEQQRQIDSLSQSMVRLAFWDHWCARLYFDLVSQSLFCAFRHFCHRYTELRDRVGAFGANLFNREAFKGEI